jgi:hypothetical protein
MGYEIDAFLGNIPELQKWKERLGSVVVYELTEKLGLVPLTSDLLQDLDRQLGQDKRSEEELVKTWCAEASRGTVIAFISAFYFGGQGGQSAEVWSNQKVVKSDVTVNSALQLLGVRAAAGEDEFDTVGLGRFRKTESWVAAERIRGHAAVVRRQSGPMADDAISELVQTARTHARMEVRLAAACALAEVGGKAVPELTALLAPDKLQNRWGIVFALGKAGPSASTAVPALIRVLKTESDGRVRVEAATTLGKIGKAARSAVPALIDALRDRSEVIRREAAWALGEIASADKAVIDALNGLLHDSDQFVRKLSAEALRKIL